MNKIIYKLLCVLGIGIALAACNDDFLNTKPLGEVSEEDVWTDASLAEAFVTEIYNGLGQGGFNEQMLSSLTDESIFTHPGRGINTITESRSNPADIGWINGTLNWPNMYSRIRACNLALKNLESAQFENTNQIVERLKGETYFMRAYFYQQLVRYYGGVPLIERPYELGEADYLINRNTFEECVTFIVNDCDKAAELLGDRAMAKGRGSKAAALALKSRILLYAASDLHDIPTASAKSTTIGGFAQKELLGYTSGDRATRWQNAKSAAKAVLDLPGYGYQLNLSGPVATSQGTTNYMNASLSKNGGEAELLFARYFINLKTEDGGRVGLFNGPNGYHNWAGNTPIQNLVDDYEMMDGSKFDWSNPAHASAPYTNRDPRLDATVLHDGSGWKPRTTDGAGKDPYNQIQTGQYQVTDKDNKVVPYFGLDTRQSSIEDWNGTRTGYYMRKFIDPNPAIVDQNTWQEIPWPFFRYTEAIFNYAEACIELGEDEEAKTWLNKIRFRAGMPAITETGDALRQRYRNERRVEMAYEEQRYHDARRWMIAPTTLGEKAGIISITATLKPGKIVPIYRYDPQNYNYTYTPLDIDPGIENRQWLDKMYYLPVSRDEINRNSKLIQNPGY